MLTGVGAHFSAGGDAELIVDRVQQGETALLAMMRSFHRLIEEIWNSPLPVVAAVGGLAHGGGFDLAPACDLVACAADARWCQVFLRRGVVPDLGGAYLLPRLVGMQRAKELMLLTPEIDAHREFLRRRAEHRTRRPSGAPPGDGAALPRPGCQTAR